MFFSKLNKKKPGSLAPVDPPKTIPATGQIRITKVKVPVRQSPQNLSKSHTSPIRRHSADARSRQSSASPDQTAKRLKKSQKLKRPSTSISSSLDTDYDDSSWEADFHKRQSLSATPPVGDRRSNLYGGDVETVRVIESASLMKYADYKPCFKSQPNLQFELAMPCTEKRERYFAYKPKQEDEYDPTLEVEFIMDMVANNLVPEKYIAKIRHPSLGDCVARRYKRAIKQNDPGKFIASIQEYNTLMHDLRVNGQIKEHIQGLRHMPVQVSRTLLNQVYSRVVSPHADDLREYEAFSNNVYGELLPEFVARLFKETFLKSDHVFVDLGSGVANCTLQAALEIGCESWGCEVMKTASTLARRQKLELEERVKMYGFRTGEIHLVATSFVHNDEIQKVIARADVVLVNNYAFDGKLNAHLIDMFLDLKDGCKIISLKSFVPPGHVISEHNIESPLNMLEVERKEFPSGSVSWTSTAGPYFISTVDRSRLQKYLEGQGRRRRG